MRIQSNAQSSRGTEYRSRARPPSDGSIVSVDGKRIDSYTAQLLRRAEQSSGMDFHVSQGGFNRGGVRASAGTHDGAGSLDLRTAGKSRGQIEQMVRSLREAGFAAWYRSGPGWSGNEHIHAVAIGAPGLSSEARQQVQSYLNGRDGLARNGRDPHLSTIGRPLPSWVNGASAPGSGAEADVAFNRDRFEDAPVRRSARSSPSRRGGGCAAGGGGAGSPTRTPRYGTDSFTPASGSQRVGSTSPVGRGASVSLPGGAASIDFNGTRYTSIEGSAANSALSIDSIRRFDPLSENGIALTTAQARALGVKVGESVTIRDLQTGRTFTAVYYDNAGTKPQGLRHFEVSPALADALGIRYRNGSGQVVDAVTNPSEVSNRFVIEK